MSIVQRIAQAIHALFHGRKLDADMNEEMSAHIQMRAEANIASGMAPGAARAAAQRQFGPTTSFKELCRDQRGIGWLEAFLQDLRYGARQLGRHSGFAAIGILTLALGIGSTTAIFSVVNAVLLRPLPYPEAARLVELTDNDGPIAIPNFVDWKDHQSSFEDLFLYRAANFNVRTGTAEPMRVLGVQLSATAFSTLRIDPQVGRFYLPAEDVAGGLPVAVLGHHLWLNQYGGSPDVVGRLISINEIEHTVVGVMPASFELVERADIFIPVEPGISSGDRSNRKNQSGYQAVARLKSGVSLEQARLELDGLARRLAEQYPDTDTDRPIGIKSLLESKVGGVRATLWILFGAAVLVLLIACGNVANLIMVRATGRRHELTVRSALGASRARIFRQILTESLLLAGLGAALGVLLAQWITALIETLAIDSLPRAAEIGVDGRAILFSTALAFFTGIVAGLAPAWKSSRPGISAMLNEASRGSSASRSTLLHGLLVGQVALSVILLVGAALLLQSFSRLTGVNPGFNYEQALSFRVDLPADRYPSTADIGRFSRTLLERLGALPGVQEATLATELPLGGRSWATALMIEGRPEEQQSIIMEVNLVGADYFKVMGIPLLRGRSFGAADVLPPDGPTGPSAMKSIIIDEEFARRYFQGEDPLGRQIRLPWGSAEQNPVMTIVGVAGRVKHEKIRDSSEASHPIGYLAYQEWPNRFIAVVMRTTLPPEALGAVSRQAVSAIDPGLPIYDVRSLADLRKDNIAPERLQLALVGGAAAIAFILAVFGIYGVLAFGVAQRRREIGVRMALGAQRWDVVTLVLGQGLRLVALGLSGGVAGALLANRVLSSLLYQVETTDAATYLAVIALLLVAAAIACVVPARRAASLDPMPILKG